MHVRLRLFALALVTSITTPTMVAAQQPQSKETVAAAGPRLELTATAMHRAAVKDTAVVLATRTQEKRAVALMIVGGAAIVLGAVIGGDVGTLFMIGGAVAGLIGLYQYLQ